MLMTFKFMFYSIVTLSWWAIIIIIEYQVSVLNVRCLSVCLELDQVCLEQWLPDLVLQPVCPRGYVYVFRANFFVKR